MWLIRSAIILVGVIGFLWVGMNNADQNVDPQECDECLGHAVCLPGAHLNIVEIRHGCIMFRWMASSRRRLF